MCIRDRIYRYEDAVGFQRFQIAKIRSFHQPILTFTTHAEAWAFLLKNIKDYSLCPKLCGVQKPPKACYAYREQNCRGACCGEESTDRYNARIDQFIHSLSRRPSKILIKEKGRRQKEQAAILFDQGLF